MKLSIVIPCFNEKRTIVELIDAVRSAPIQDKQIIIVDDGSTDGTREILKGITNQAEIEIIYHEKNKGKGAALSRVCSGHWRNLHCSGCRPGVRPARIPSCDSTNFRWKSRCGIW